MAREISRIESIALAAVASTALLAAAAGIAYYGVNYFYDKVRECQESSDTARFVDANGANHYGGYDSGTCPEKQIFDK